MTEFRTFPLSTGVTLNVGLSGERNNPAILLLHGFPESHRTWREIIPKLQDRFFLVTPDQRGFAGSDRPQDVDAYKTDRLIDDVFALAEAVGIERFSLLGHDWGGAIAWGAALRHDRRLARLAIVNAPHPLVFQKSLIESQAQRAASQYITAFRAPGFEKMVEAKGFEWFFELTFSAHSVMGLISETEKRQYLADWSQPGAFNAMLNWYRASKLVVPPPGPTMPLPEWLLRPLPKVSVPTLVIWGMRDAALLPVQLEGLDELVEDLSVVRLPEAGHFAPWQAAEQVAEAVDLFLVGECSARACPG